MHPSDPAALLRPPAASLADHVGRTLRLAGPVMLGRAGVLLMSVVDTAMCGWAGAETLAAFGVSVAPQITMLVIGIGVLIGTVVLTAQADGAGRRLDCGRAWLAGLTVAIGLGLIFALVLTRSDLVFDLMAPEPSLRPAVEPALVAFAWGMPAIMMFVATTLFLEGIGRSLPGMVVTLSANLLNAALNWVLIFGHGGLEPLGAEGANLATSITRWAMMLVIAGYVLRFRDGPAYGIGPGRAGGAAVSFRRMLWRTVRLGVPLSAATVFESTAFMMLSVYAARMGAAQIAAYQIMMNLLAMVFMLGIGVSTATGVRVGNAVGRGDPEGVRTAGWVGIGLISAVLVVLAPTAWLFGGAIVAPFTDDPAVVGLALAMLPVMALAMLFDSLQTVANGALRGTGDVMVPAGVFLVAFWGVTVPVAWSLGRGLDWGPVGLSWGIVAGVAVASLLLMARFHRVVGRPIRYLT